jgi:hypothetical protein
VSHRPDLRTSVLAVKVLGRTTGLGMARVLWRALKRERRGEPWRDLGPPADEREAFTRDDIGLVVLVYEELRARRGQAEALPIVAELVREGIVIRLRALLPPIERAAYEAMGEPERRAFLEAIVAQFPSCHIGELRADDERFSYRVTRCELVELVRRVGHPELSGLFCVGDGLYFARHTPQVRLDRGPTLAEGAGGCDFCFSWRGSADGTGRTGGCGRAEGGGRTDG